MADRYVVIVDDDEAIRHSTSFMLRHAGFQVKTYPDGPPFLGALSQLPENACILLDVRMPDMDGLTVLARLRAAGVALPVIILTGHGDVTTAVAAMKAGATDFLEKPYKKDALLHAIETAFQLVAAGSAELTARDAALAEVGALTPRERDVLSHLAGGLTNKAIAAELDISPRTVEIHRANLMTKLKADSLSQALKIAFAAGLGDDGDR